MSAILLILLSSLGGASAQAAPTTEQLVAVWKRWEPVIAAEGKVPIHLDEKDLARVAQGGVESTLLQGEVMLASQGAQWIPQPCSYFWAALQDPEHLPVGKQDTELSRLPGSTAARRLNYQLVHTPWPLADRQQVFTVTANAALWQATQGQVWERSVAMASPDLAPNPDPDAVWIPHTAGGFVLIEAEGGCLTLFQLEVDPGGSIPADLATRLGTGMMKRNMEQLASHAAGTPKHYTGSHARVLRPDGSAIEPSEL